MGEFQIDARKPRRRPHGPHRTLGELRQDFKSRARGEPLASAPKPAPLPPPIIVHDCEIDAAPGLEDVLWQELLALLPGRVERLAVRPGSLRIHCRGDLRTLLRLRTAQAVYSLRRFAIPRPKAFLGDQHFKTLLAQIEQARDIGGEFHSLFLNAAGSDSSVMTRLKTDLAERADLVLAEREGDLLLRIRPAPEPESGWETLVRLTPRPLGTRAWRVCSREGSLNAAVAAAMIRLSAPTPDDRVLNIGCGGGTLLIERAAFGPAHQLAGYDTDPAALECAAQNVGAAGFGSQIELRLGDARELPMAAGSINVLLADLPFGQLVGSHTSNLLLYPALLDEAARVTVRGGRAVIITHEIKLLESLLEEHPKWSLQQMLKITLNGLHPRIYVLERR